MSINRALLRASAATVVLGLSCGIASAAQTGRGDERSAITIKNFGRVNDHYYRGAQPNTQDYVDLAAFGIKTVIDLTRDGEVGERRAVEAAGMKFYRIPMTTHDQPAPEAVELFLKIVNDSANLPVFVHCQGGRHRTGVMTAIYRLTHDGWTADQAYAEMKQYQFETGFGHGALKNFVYDYVQLDRARTAPSQRAMALPARSNATAANSSTTQPAPPGCGRGLFLPSRLILPLEIAPPKIVRPISF